MDIVRVTNNFKLCKNPSDLFFKIKFILTSIIQDHLKESEVAQLCPTLCYPMEYIAHQAPLSMDFPGKNTGVSCHFLHPGDLPNPGIKPSSPALQADTLTSELPGKLLNPDWF